MGAARRPYDVRVARDRLERVRPRVARRCRSIAYVPCATGCLAAVPATSPHSSLATGISASRTCCAGRTSCTPPRSACRTATARRFCATASASSSCSRCGRRSRSATRIAAFAAAASVARRCRASTSSCRRPSVRGACCCSKELPPSGSRWHRPASTLARFALDGAAVRARRLLGRAGSSGRRATTTCCAQSRGCGARAATSARSIVGAGPEERSGCERTPATSDSRGRRVAHLRAYDEMPCRLRAGVVLRPREPADDVVGGAVRHGPRRGGSCRAADRRGRVGCDPRGAARTRARSSHPATGRRSPPRSRDCSPRRRSARPGRARRAYSIEAAAERYAAAYERVLSSR